MNVRYQGQRVLLQGMGNYLHSTGLDIGPAVREILVHPD